MYSFRGKKKIQIPKLKIWIHYLLTFYGTIHLSTTYTRIQSIFFVDGYEFFVPTVNNA
jgi:hypothetical protein